MRINPVSFGKIFLIRYKQNEETKQSDLNLRMARDYRKLFTDYCDHNVEKIECRDDYIPDRANRLSTNGIRFFTGNSYEEYKMLKKIDSDMAEQYASKEAKRLYIEV